MRLTYPLKPISHAVSTESPSLFMTPGFSPWASNGRIEQKSFKKRPGYLIDRAVGRFIYGVHLFQTLVGSRYTLYLTDTDLAKKETGTGETFSYVTKTYTTGTVSGVSGANVTGNGTAWDTNAKAGDKFIMAADLSANVEPDEHWATIQTVGGATAITLSGNYAGATTTGNYIIRRVYSVPTDERWSTAILDDKFIFTNGNVNVQYYNGSGAAADLDATYAVKARFCIEYANRLFLGDYEDSVAGRLPTSIRWSKEGDPTTWVDSTAGELDLIETEDFLAGLGKVGTYLVIYKRDNIHVYTRTGVATNPITLVAQRRGIGCAAPYSIIEFMGTNAFVGRDDFYMMNGDTPIPIGEKIRTKFFDITPVTAVENVWGAHDPLRNELLWTASTLAGKYAFVYNYKHNEWYTYEFPDDMTAFGRGAL